MLWTKTSCSSVFSLSGWMALPVHHVDQWWLAIVSREPSPDNFQSLAGHLQGCWQSLGLRPVDEAFSYGSHALILPLRPSLSREMALMDLLAPSLWEQLRPVLCPDSHPSLDGNPSLDVLPGYTVDIRDPRTLKVRSGTDVQTVPAWWRPLLPPELTIAPSMEARAIFESARWMGVQRLNIIGGSPPLVFPPPGLVYLTGDSDLPDFLSAGDSSGVVSDNAWEPHGWLTSPDTIPRHLRDIAQWVVWGISARENGLKPSKIPVQPRTYRWDGELQSWRPHAGRGPGWSGNPRPSPAVRMMCARSNQETTWGTFAEALEFLSSHPSAIIRRASGEQREDGRPVYVSEVVPLRGLQFALHPGNQLLGIDIDHCIANGRIAPEIQDILQCLPGYWEYSPSLTGLRGFFVRPEALEVPSSREFAGIEIYDGRSPRFLTVTGQHLGTPEIGKLPLDGWNWVIRQLRQHFARPGRPVVPVIATVPAMDPSSPDVGTGVIPDRSVNGLSPSNARGQSAAALNPELRRLDLSSVRTPLPDEVLLDYIRQSPRHGARFEFYFQLWDMQPPEQFPAGIEPRPSWTRGDRSRGDSQMIFILTSYTQDPLQIDRIFRSSPRMRPKWDRLISQGGETYAEYVIGYNLGLRGVSLPFGFLERHRHGVTGGGLTGVVSPLSPDFPETATPGAGQGNFSDLTASRPFH